MLSKRSASQVVFVMLIVIALLGLPVMADAQTQNGITSPEDGATVSGQVEVTGYASGPTFMKWQLDLLPNDNPDAAIFLTLGSTQGVFTYTLSSTLYPDGPATLRLRVVHEDSNYDEYSSKITIANQGTQPAAEAPAASAAMTTTATVTTTAAAPAPTAAVTTTAAVTPTAAAPAPAPAAPAAEAATPTENGITSPADGATVSGQVEVTGYASSPNFMKWQLDLLPNDNPDAAIFLALGNAQGVFTYTLDSTLYPDGPATLRVRVVHEDSNYDEYSSKITIANQGAQPAAEAPAASAAMTTTATVTTTAAAPAPTAAVTTTAAVTPTAAAPAPAPAAPAAEAATPTENGITSPADGATVSGQVEVTGYASSPNFMKWQLDLVPDDNPDAAIFLALGSAQGVFTTTLNSTQFLDGSAALAAAHRARGQQLRRVQQQDHHPKSLSGNRVTRQKQRRSKLPRRQPGACCAFVLPLGTILQGWNWRA